MRCVLQITEVHLLRLLKDYGAFVSSVHEDTGVRAQDIQPAPSWSLDRIDQAFLPLDKQFHFYNLGTGVNVYIIDTVGSTCRAFTGQHIIRTAGLQTPPPLGPRRGKAVLVVDWSFTIVHGHGVCYSLSSVDYANSIS